LNKDTLDIWLDKEKLPPGQDWELEIQKAVRESNVVIVCLSKQFNQAGFRQKEVRIALDTALEKPEGEIFIIPAKLEECDTPDSLRKWQWVNLFEQDGYDKLTRALEVRKNKLRKKDQPPKTILRNKSLENRENITQKSQLITRANELNRNSHQQKSYTNRSSREIDRLQNEIAELEGKFINAVHQGYDKHEIIRLVADTEVKVGELNNFVDDTLTRLIELKTINLRNYYYR